MSSNKFLGAATSFALVAVIGGSAIAQTATVTLPAELEALSLSDIKSEEKRGGFVEVDGRAADGYDIEAMLDPQGKLVGVEVDDGKMPQSLIDALLPQTVRDDELMTQFAVIDSIKSVRDTVGVEGEDSAGEDLYALFDQDGRMLRFGRDDDDMRDKKHRGGMKGGDGQHAGHGMQRDGDSAGRDMPPAPEFDAAAVNKKLTEAGYTDFGFMRADGRDVTLEAVNPQGETVVLELDPKGEVVRETAR